MIAAAAFVKAYWRPLVALLLVAVGSLTLLRVGYGVADRSWQEKWDQRDKADADAKLAFTQEQRRIELTRQAEIDNIQREADEENRKADAQRLAAERAADRLQSGIQNAIAQLQQRRGDDTGTATSGKTGRNAGDLLAQLYREIDSTAGELAAEADRRGRVALTCERAYDAIRNSSLNPARKQPEK
ncbi:DUF2514 family protein [Pantoea eucalypti]|uniref:DUF2514 family protein n=1 Tax=Pantoea eucalypti TaxID=470933 RepID=UPI003EE79DFA